MTDAIMDAFNAVLGGLVIFTIAADSQHSITWEYKVVDGDLQYNVPWAYSTLINQTATNGWEVVSSQLFPPADPNALNGAHAYVVLRRSKQWFRGIGPRSRRSQTDLDLRWK
jgi:hypothetical protein